MKNKLGYRCADCNRFIVYSDLPIITCPYSDCFFSGDVSELKRMRKPAILGPIEVVKPPPANIVPILNVIDDQLSTLQYTSVSCTMKQKTFVLQAFTSLLRKYPDEMVPYLTDGKRGNRLQSKLFQEYVSILESNLPFSYKTSSGIIQVDSLTHPSINPFSGLSKFDAVVEDNLTIKNKTSEIYIGNRKSYYCQPFYIGKLLDVVDDYGISWIHGVKDYSFSVIKTNLAPGTRVHVSHLRIPAHYQVGILSHINRIKKSLSDSLKAS
jgi:hypothetical protein